MVYDDFPDILSTSLNEVRKIMEWAESTVGAASSDFVIYGGWGVYSYNPWYGSIDVDIILNNRVRKKFMRGFVGPSAYDVQGGAGLRTISKRTPHGDIVLDLKSKGGLYTFEGRERSDGIDLSFLDDHVISRAIDGDVSITVPDLESIIILKLKAVWDREYRLRHRTSGDPDWDHSKLTKDKCDVLALLDPNVNDLDIYVLGDLLESRPFLVGSLRSCVDDVCIDRYARFPEDVKDFIETMIELMGMD